MHTEKAFYQGSCLQPYVIHVLLQLWVSSFQRLPITRHEAFRALCDQSLQATLASSRVSLTPFSSFPSISYHRTFAVTLPGMRDKHLILRALSLGPSLPEVQKPLSQLWPQPPLCRCLSLHISQPIWLPYSLVVSIDSYRQGSCLPCLPWCHRSCCCCCCWGRYKVQASLELESSGFYLLIPGIIDMWCHI